MTTPRPRLDLFNDSPCLVAKKCRTSTPSLRPPKPPTKSSKNNRRQSFYATQQTQNIEFIEKIGSGYFADVYKVKSLQDGQYYALKKTLIPFTSDSDRLRKLQEVKNHKLLPPHPNCVRYYDSWEEDGFLYIQTELCQTSLNQLLEQCDERKLPENIVWNYLLDLLLAVKHLHDHDLLHLDIKPDNIFISFEGHAKLGDFGLMCNCLDLNSSTIAATTTSSNNSVEQQQQQSNNSIMETSSFFFDEPEHPQQQQQQQEQRQESHNNDGSFDDSFMPMDHDDSGIVNKSDDSIDSIDEGDSKYLAGETMQGKFTKAADIFSLGITIFEVASGLELPQRGEIYHKLRHNEIEDLYFNGLSQELVKVIKLMMEEEYTKRATVEDLLEIVDHYCQQLRRKRHSLHHHHH